MSRNHTAGAKQAFRDTRVRGARAAAPLPLCDPARLRVLPRWPPRSLRRPGAVRARGAAVLQQVRHFSTTGTEGLPFYNRDVNS
jgi:hypothetical protein